MRQYVLASDIFINNNNTTGSLKRALLPQNETYNTQICNREAPSSSITFYVASVRNLLHPRVQMIQKYDVWM